MFFLHLAGFLTGLPLPVNRFNKLQYCFLIDCCKGSQHPSLFPQNRIARTKVCFFRITELSTQVKS
jgi:hypothetical protein